MTTHEEASFTADDGGTEGPEVATRLEAVAHLPIEDLVLGSALRTAVERVIEAARSRSGHLAAHGSSPHTGE